MRRTEIARKFDEIVSFAEVDRFLDTPVKRYSSGMYMRLAFSVAAHLEPEILVVDEVLAVGDVEFQKKCLGKMKAVGQEGRTVLFVSHQLAAIRSLCDRGIVLRRGQVMVDQPIDRAISAYLMEAGGQDSFERPPQPNGKPTLVNGRVHVTQSHVRITVNIASEIHARVHVHTRLTDSMGIAAGFGSVGYLDPQNPLALQPGSNRLAYEFPVTQLANGTYFVSIEVWLPDLELFDRFENCFSIEVVRPPIDGFTRALAQSAGVGNLELPVTLISDQRQY
jgi:lipopolysaccharide transport system ATP-binding protein